MKGKAPLKPKNKGTRNPPQIQPNFLVGHRFRYLVTGSSGFTGNINESDIMNQLLMATSGSTMARLFDGVKIKAIELWSPATNANLTSGALPNTISLEWINQTVGIGAPGTSFSDTALGFTDIAHIFTKPPKGSAAAMWLTHFNEEPENLFSLDLPQCTVIDIICTVSFRAGDGAEDSGLTFDGTATLGQVYGNELSPLSGVLPRGYSFIPTV